MIKPLAEKWFMTPEELAIEKKLAHERAAANEVGSGGGSSTKTPGALVVVAWLFVAIPLAWAIYRTSLSIAKMFS